MKKTKVLLPSTKEIEKYWNEYINYITNWHGAIPTDLTLMLGASSTFEDNLEIPLYVDESDLTDTAQYCKSWTMNNFYDEVTVSGYNAHYEPIAAYSRDISILPVLKILNFFKDKVLDKEIEYGEYPQFAPSKSLQHTLEEKYNNNDRELAQTPESYTFDSCDIDDEVNGFQGVKYNVYEYQGKKYIRVKVNAGFAYDHYDKKEQKKIYRPKRILLSNGCIYQTGDYVWVEISPVKWHPIIGSEVLLSKYALLSGIKYCDDFNGYDGKFNKTFMSKYLNEIFLRDLLQYEMYENELSDSETKEGILTRIKEKIAYNGDSEDAHEDELSELEGDIYKIFDEQMKKYYLERYKALRREYERHKRTINSSTSHVHTLRYYERLKDIRRDLDPYLESINQLKR